MMNGFGGHGWGGMGFGGWGWILGLIVLVAIIWLALKALDHGRGSNKTDEKSPLDILKERYARGEIDREEFKKRKKDLM